MSYALEQGAARVTLTPPRPECTDVHAATRVAHDGREIARRRAADAHRDAPALFIDRDLSFIRFQDRVLEESQDERTPLLDRVKFLAILHTNIDDFITVRAPELRSRPEKRVIVEATLKSLVRRAQAYWRRRLMPRLASAGIHLVEYSTLGEDERRDVRAHFTQFVLPLLSSLTWQPGQPFPQVPSAGLNIAVWVRGESGEQLRIVRIPDSVSRLVPFRWRRGAPADSAVGSAAFEPRGYVWVSQAVAAHIAALLPGADTTTAHLFRVLREATLPPTAHPTACERALEAISLRETNPVVALIADRRMCARMLGAIVTALDVPPALVHRAKIVVDPRRQWEVTRIPRPDLHASPIAPRICSQLRDDPDVFAAIRRGDILLHHPYDSFQPVVDLIARAAEDPDVLSISMSLYRTDRESPVAHALLDAVRRGKQVRLLIELNARFDEYRNATWTRVFEQAGASVFHAPPGLKVHAKMALITRHESAGVRRYAHLSSGNYNLFTSRVYTDLALLTADAEITADLADLFDVLTGSARPIRFRRLLVAPVTLRDSLEQLVEREMRWRRRGAPAHIILKMNALSDRDVISLLYRASRAGVRVDLLVRGICGLRPGITGTSEHIHVRSIVGRFLEHSRAWYFHNGGNEEVYIGSADLMPRNLNRRVEVMAPLRAPAIIQRVRNGIFGRYLADNVKARCLHADGTYTRVASGPGEAPVNAQLELLNLDPGWTA